MIIRKLELSEQLRAQQISHIAFEYLKDYPLTLESFLAFEKKKPEELPERWAAFDEKTGEMMAAMRVIPFLVYYYGTPVPMMGIGDVSTLPEYRRVGAIRGCFDAALCEMFEDGQVFSSLYPFSNNFYRKFGYENTAENVVWILNTADIPRFRTGGKMELLSPCTDGDLSDYISVYQRMAKNINMMVVRDESCWKKRLSSQMRSARGIERMNYSETQQFAHLWRDDFGVPQGYMSYIREGDVMVTQEFVFANREALYALLAFIRTFSSYYEKVAIILPPSVPFDRISSELPLEKMIRKSNFTCMTRIVNVNKAFMLKKYPGEGKFTIQIHDENIRENNGCFAVEFWKDGAKTSETNEEPDIEMSIGDLARLLTGHSGYSDIPYMSGVKIHRKNESLALAFSRKPVWINDYF